MQIPENESGHGQKKSEGQPHFFQWGLTAFCVIVASVLIIFLFFRMDTVAGFLKNIIGILTPFIYGFVIAYLLLPVFNGLYRFFRPRLSGRKRGLMLAKGLSTALSLLFGLIIIVGLLWMVIPQLISSIISLSYSLDTYLNQISDFIASLLKGNAVLEKNFLAMSDELSKQIVNWVQNSALPQLQNLMTGVVTTVSVVVNWLIGIVIAVYILSSKDTFCAQAKKILYSFLPVQKANYVMERTRYIHHVFGSFISGKLLDSLIIGIICFVGLMILQLKFGDSVLIATIIAVTNIIPFFGPIIGAIPSVLLVFVISPIKALYVLIFILLLQQFDGNILGPKILGDSTGLSSFWVMFAILMFGGIFGFAGMLIGVPLFAVIYSIATERLNRRLKRRGLSTDTLRYRDGMQIDPKTGDFVSPPQPQHTQSKKDQRRARRKERKSK